MDGWSGTIQYLCKHLNDKEMCWFYFLINDLVGTDSWDSIRLVSKIHGFRRERHGILYPSRAVWRGLFEVLLSEAFHPIKLINCLCQYKPGAML